MAIIRCENLSKSFRIYRHPADHLKEILSFGRRQYHEPFWAVRDATLSVDKGCCVGIIGENGSGKSTLLRLIARVIRPTSGTLEVHGRVSALLELGAGFNPQFTGRENVFLNAAILGFSDAETRERLPAIEKFAEIGAFIDCPVKTYSSGMFVRLAFSVAVHLDPDILIVDEALSVGDIFFQQRCIRRIQHLKHSGVTIVFVSHDLAAVRSLADQTIWMEHGRVHLQGSTDDVVSRYLAAMVTRGSKDRMEEEAIGRPIERSLELDYPASATARLPEFLTVLPNVDHRYGNGRATVRGIGVFNTSGEPVTSLAQGDRVCVRVSVEFHDAVPQPNVGFMLRNRLGEDITGTNLMFEGERIESAEAGSRVSVDFILDVPYLHGGFYYISPAVADGTLDQYEMCDWVESACAIEVVEHTTTYGHLRIPMKVRALKVADSTKHQS